MQRQEVIKVSGGHLKKHEKKEIRGAMSKHNLVGLIELGAKIDSMQFLLCILQRLIFFPSGFFGGF